MSSSNGAPPAQAAMPSSPIEEKANGGSRAPAAQTMPTLGYTDQPQSAVTRRTRHIFYLRLLAFFIIEVGYIILAAVCLAKPIPLKIHLKLSDSEVKGGFTVIFIVWQSLAIIAGGHILADAFSREWSVQLAQIVPGTTDRVSTVTSGFLDRTLHLFTKKASGTFKLAFLASLSFMALTQLAPGTISAATTLIDLPTTVQVGKLLSQVPLDGLQAVITAQRRANLILRLELIERSPFGFKLQPNMLTAVPMVNLGDLNGTLEYNSDIAEFHHDCHWEAPQFFNDSTLGVVVQAAGQQWSGAIVGQGTPASSISPLSLTSFQIMENVGTSIFMFVGGNGTFHDNRFTPPASFAINLGTLPATFISAGVGVTVAGGNFVGPLASILVCNPNLKISGGRVRLSKDGTLDIIASGGPTIGNIPASAINLIFGNAFQDTLLSLEALESTNIVNNVASNMFMGNLSVDWNTAQNISPLDLASINKNVDTFMLSAAKAFIDGYRKNGTSASTTFDLETIPATGQEQRLALTTSRGLFITDIVMVVIATSLLYALCRSALTQKRYPFDLSSVFTVLREDDGRRASLLVPTRQGSVAV